VIVSGDKWGDGLNDFDCHVAAVPQSNFNNSETKQHPAQKPVSVMRWLINATTQPGDVVCDPFCGSGTTGIASVQLKRRFHGIEISEEYRNLSEKRIATYGIISE
jgi:site-specific DNA-methyltransferase (adenine-specific)